MKKSLPIEVTYIQNHYGIRQPPRLAPIVQKVEEYDILDCFYSPSWQLKYLYEVPDQDLSHLAVWTGGDFQQRECTHVS